MTRFQITTTIHQPIDIVATALERPHNTPQWCTFLDRFARAESTTADAPAPDAICYDNDISSAVMVARIETMLLRKGNRTQMRLVWSATGHTLWTRIMLTLLRRKMAKAARADLARFRKLAETRGGDFGRI